MKKKGTLEITLKLVAWTVVYSFIILIIFIGLFKILF